MIATKSSIRLAPSAHPESLTNDNGPIALADSAVANPGLRAIRASRQSGWPRRTGLVPSRSRSESPEQTSVGNKLSRKFNKAIA